MRDIFIGQEFYWEIVSKDGKALNDIVKLKSINEIDSEDLPLENAYFSLFSEELQEYADSISKKVLGGEFDSFPMLTNEALKDINDGNEINVQVKYNMVSVVAEALEEDTDITALISKNTVAILMPYMRSELSLLTAQPGMECIVMPPINVNAMMEQSQK